MTIDPDAPVVSDVLPAGVWPQVWAVVAFSETGAWLYHRVFVHVHTAERHARVAPRAAGAARVEIIPCRLVPVGGDDR